MAQTAISTIDSREISCRFQARATRACRTSAIDAPVLVAAVPHSQAREAELERSTAWAPETSRAADEARNGAEAWSLAELAHDLCSPLNTILIVAEFLSVTGAAEEQNENVETIIRATEHMLGIVNDIFDRVGMEAGGDVARVGDCDLHSLVNDVLKIVEPLAADKDLRVVVSQGLAIPRYVRTDAAKLRRILINLLDNAIKYTQEGSVALSLDTADSADPAVLRLIFQVRDTGIGISAEDQTRIFERLVRVPGSGRARGSGLGLAIASRYVYMLGGSMQVESTPGVGASFRVELPVPRAGTGVPSRRCPPSGGGPARESLCIG